MTDVVKPLKTETTVDMGIPTEVNPLEDLMQALGVVFGSVTGTRIEAVSGNILGFTDSQIVTVATLKDLVERIKRKDVDLTNLINNYVLTWNNSTQRFELQPTGGSGGGSGVTPPFIFSKAGSAGTGTYLRTGEAVTSNTGQIIKGSNKISQISASNGSNVGSTTRLQLQRRTSVNTFVDIASAFVDIPSGQFSGTVSGLAVPWGPDWEMSAYVKSGSSLDNPVLVVYLLPS